MTHEYSIQIHNWITNKIEQIKSQKRASEQKDDAEKIEYLSGQLEELMFLQSYLTEHTDLITQTY